MCLVGKSSKSAYPLGIECAHGCWGEIPIGTGCIVSMIQEYIVVRPGSDRRAMTKRKIFAHISA